MTENNTFIQIRELHKNFTMGRNIVRALDGVDLDIPANSFTVVMGPSGSGKSTLLYLLGGLDRITSGSIRIDGQRLETMDENALAVYRRREVGFIFQSFNLISSMTALDNVSFPMRFAGISGRARKQRAVTLLKQVGLEKRANHRPTELSGGQQQRVAIARALVNDPRLILADEPTGNLDTGSGYAIMQLLSELHKDGRTVVVVTHDIRMSHFATHMLYLLDGKTVSEADYRAASEFNPFEIPAEEKTKEKA
ncbi:ABC-type antimicrobial peptide transport system, ATPase component [Longilinea arvoryzae]|uniref:ABC-type antimicrobial peptide transport system, ATPase component n=1 Tax=Longilinea arvoryzae TaxID=360412 RepID=A0A0S7BDJ7_9CHLR|nr:ABC transporter ATP-binding protein [Longilinea arvoryzae]GAP12912.1 ABC-type antimicrobial peptide transport system, ATPase component [Longilinea arvoryzae]